MTSSEYFEEQLRSAIALLASVSTGLEAEPQFELRVGGVGPAEVDLAGNRAGLIDLATQCLNLALASRHGAHAHLRDVSGQLNVYLNDKQLNAHA